MYDLNANTGNILENTIEKLSINPNVMNNTNIEKVKNEVWLNKQFIRPKPNFLRSMEYVQEKFIFYLK